MEIALDKQQEQKLIASIRRYLDENFELEIGELQASLFLSYCLEEIGPHIYNRAIADAQGYMQEKALDMENNCFVNELDYWIKQDRKRERQRK